MPIGIFLATQSRKIHDLVFMLLVFGTCMPETFMGLPTDINFLSREWYRGSTRGIEISYLDLLAIILLVSSIMIRRRERRPVYFPPSLGLLLTFLAWCFINVAIFSDPKLFGVFELTKIARSALLFMAVSAYIRSPREIHLFVWSLAITMFYEAAICLRDRYLFGIHRIRGTLGHPNSLSMYSLQCLPIFIAAIFAVDVKIWMRNVCILAFCAAAGCVLLSISRTGFAAMVLLSGAGFILGTGLKMTPRNMGLALLGLILCTFMVAKAWDSTMSRLGGFDLQHEYFSEEGDRGAYFRQAAPAIADYPLTGFGLNNWSYHVSARYAVLAGYGDRGYEPYPSLNTPPDPRSAQAAPAHNFYLLTLTELGIPGFLLLMALIFRWMWINGSVFLGRRELLIDALRVGIFLSLGGILLQSWTEWEFRQTPMYFLGHITMAVGAALYHYRGKAARP